MLVFVLTRNVREGLRIGLGSALELGIATISRYHQGLKAFVIADVRLTIDE